MTCKKTKVLSFTGQLEMVETGLNKHETIHRSTATKTI